MHGCLKNIIPCLLFLLMYLHLPANGRNSFKESKPSIKSSGVDTTVINILFEKYKEEVNNDYIASRGIFDKLIYQLRDIPGNLFGYKAKIYSELISCENRSGNIAFTDTSSLEILEKVKNNKDSMLYPMVYFARASCFKAKGELDSAFFYAEKSNIYASKYNNIEYVLKSTLMLGIVNAYKGKYKRAEEIFKEGIFVARENNKWQSLSEMSQSLAIIYKRTGNISSALNLYKESIELLEKHNSRINYPEALNNIATLYMKLGIDSLAIRYFKKSTSVSRDQNSVMILTIGLVNLGSYELKYGNDSLAYTYFSEAEKISKAYQFPGSEVIVLNYMGQYHLNRGNDEEALKKFLSSKKLANEIQDIDTYISSSIAITSILYNRGELGLAKAHALEAFTLSLENNFSQYVPEAARFLAKIELKQKNQNKAIYYYQVLDESLARYNDSLNANNNRNFGYRFELQRKEAENRILQKESELKEIELARKRNSIQSRNVVIILSTIFMVISLTLLLVLIKQSRHKSKINRLLKYKNKEISDYNKKLREENAFKTKLFSIVSHDIRSPVIGLKSMLHVLSVAGMKDEERVSIAEQLLHRVNYTIHLIDNILMWTKQQIKGTKLEMIEVDLKSTVLEILDYFYAEAGKNNITINNNITEPVHVCADLNTTKLVLRNLISNAVKYTNEGGEITISSKSAGKYEVVTVSDNGIGIKEEYGRKIFSPDEIFSTRGKRDEKGHGLGLYLSMKFIEKCNGTIWFESEENKGTSFFFSLLKCS